MKPAARKENCGFTLLEMSISVAILAVISLLTFTVVNSLNSGVELSITKDEVQASVRDALTAMTTELERASKKTDTGLTPSLQALAVPSASNVVFQVPVDGTGTNYSQPITYTFVNEDTNGNGILDTGEDANGDHVLTRRVTRTQAGMTYPVGTANDLSSVVFSLNAAKDMLTVTVTASAAVNNNRHDLVTATASSSVYLHN